MKTAARILSLTLFTLVALFLVWFGVTYMRAESMLWFHAASVPERARDDALPLYRALMNLIGGSSAGLGVLCLFVIWSPLRRAARGAGAVLTTALVGVFAVAAVTAETLRETTGAPTSWHVMGVLIAGTVAAFAAHAFYSGARSNAAGKDPALPTPAQAATRLCAND